MAVSDGTVRVEDQLISEKITSEHPAKTGRNLATKNGKPWKTFKSWSNSW